MIIKHFQPALHVQWKCFSFQLPEIEAKVKETNHVILTPLVSLDTPGKATVEVVILADPVSNDYMQFCFYPYILTVWVCSNWNWKLKLVKTSYKMSLIGTFQWRPPLKKATSL